MCREAASNRGSVRCARCEKLFWGAEGSPKAEGQEEKKKEEAHRTQAPGGGVRRRPEERKSRKTPPAEGKKEKGSRKAAGPEACGISCALLRIFPGRCVRSDLRYSHSEPHLIAWPSGGPPGSDIFCLRRLSSIQNYVHQELCGDGLLSIVLLCDLLGWASPWQQIVGYLVSHPAAFGYRSHH